MPTEVKFRRGSSAANNSFTGAQGEISVDTDNDVIRVHDGVTAGGFEFARADGSNSAIPIDALDDVVITSEEAGNLLTYNGTNWINSDTITNTNGNFVVERTASSLAGTNSVLRLKKTRSDSTLANLGIPGTSAGSREGASLGWVVKGTNAESYFAALRAAYVHPAASEAPESNWTFSTSTDGFTTASSFTGTVSRTVATISKTGVALNGADWVRMPNKSRTEMYSGVTSTFNTDADYFFGVGCMVLVSNSDTDPNSLGYDATDKTITVATASGTTYTVTSAAHGLKAGQEITITGMTPAAYNGRFQITAVTTDDITFTGGSADPGAGSAFGVVTSFGAPYQLAVWNGYKWNYVANGLEVTDPT